MGNRLATTTMTTTIGQDHLVAAWTTTTNTSTLPADAVPPFTVVNLAAGPNVITIPTKAAGVRIEPPLGSVNTKILKGVAGDTGVVLDPANPTTWMFPQTSMFNFVINSQVTETITLVWC